MRRSWAVAVAALTAGCLLAATGCGGSSRHIASTASSPESPPHKVELGGAPIGLLAYAGQLWVADARRNRLLRVAPQSGRVTGQVSVGRTPLRMVAFGGSIWSTDFDGGTVSVVSPSELRRVATIPVGPQPEGIVPFGGAVWVVSQQGGYLARLVPGHPGAADRVPVGYQPRQVTAGAGNLWVSAFGENSVVEVDPRTRRVVGRIRACQGPQGLAYVARRLWVSCTDGNQLAAIDPTSRRVTRRIRYEAADAVTRTGSSVLVTSDDGPAAGRLDPRTGALSKFGCRTSSSATPTLTSSLSEPASGFLARPRNHLPHPDPLTRSSCRLSSISATRAPVCVVRRSTSTTCSCFAVW